MLKLWFTRNWALKLLSFVLAFLLWLTLVPEEKIFGERTLAIPIETPNLPPDLELVDKSVSMAEVTVRAPNRALGQITANDIAVVLDLSKAAAAEADYALDPSRVIVPPNVQAVRVFPTKIRIKLERSREIEMTVVPSTVGAPREGFRVEKVEAIPAKVRIRGPESMFRTRDILRAEAVDITGIAATTEFEAGLLPPRAELRASTGLARVRIRVTVAGIAPAAKR